MFFFRILFHRFFSAQIQNGRRTQREQNGTNFERVELDLRAHIERQIAQRDQDKQVERVHEVDEQR